MIIGVLTFYDEPNFGANLQGLSTYMYLKKHGHTPVFVNYRSEKSLKRLNRLNDNVQWATHHEFVNKFIENQTIICLDEEQLCAEIERLGIEAMLVGSDAVLQHHPLICRIKKGKRKPFYIQKYVDESLFPNLFWGIGYADKIPSAMMSVSSQNSEYGYFLPNTKERMKEALSRFKYISVRDTWTRDMVKSITGEIPPVTPDPVFAFNLNASELIKSKMSILEKYHLPEKYILVSLHSQSLPITTLDELKRFMDGQGVTCVALTMPAGLKFNHNFDLEIKQPLSPIDWYALIEYAYAYVGSNMHPIVVSLHNAVPCVSIDNWGRTDFFNHKINDGSSKVEHIMSEFGVGQNHKMINGGVCDLSAEEIFTLIESYPFEAVRKHSEEMVKRYEKMMSDIILSFSTKE